MVSPTDSFVHVALNELTLQPRVPYETAKV